ncbi:MAG TPA: PT domain-containing protein, partial [Chthoniobacterales bacterium]|nr:PT domain-containing protein [Chthoniobacterales bacterium]
TAQPTTSQPTTAQPTTVKPTTIQPTRQPTTAQPTTAQPTTAQPTTAQPTKQPTDNPTQQPTLAPRDHAFVTYRGLSTDFIEPHSMTANTDGSYIMGGSVSNPSNNFNSLLGKLDANGQKKWFYEQSIPNSQIDIHSTAIMNNELFSGGSSNANGVPYGYISRHNLTSGILLSAWNTGLPSILSILPTSRNTLIALTASSPFVPFEFDPYNGIVLSEASLSGCSYNGIAAIDDHSYIIGGGDGGNPSTKACLSKISLTGTTWSSAWTRFYSVPSVHEMYINSVALRNNTAIFSSYVNGTTGFIGSVDATTGATHWLTSIGGTSSSNLNTVIFANNNLDNTNQIMATGYICSPDCGGWYVLMNLNNGTLSKSVKLIGANNIIPVVANDDGTFTSLGNDPAGRLLFVTLNKNLEIDPSISKQNKEEDSSSEKKVDVSNPMGYILPPGMSFSDNSKNIVLGAQNITSTASSFAFSARSPSLVTDITSQFSVVNDSMTEVVQSTAQPTFQPTSASGGSSKSSSSNSTYVIAGGAAGGIAITSAIICALRKKFVRDYLKKYVPCSMICEGDIEQQSGKQIQSAVKVSIQNQNASNSMNASGQASQVSSDSSEQDNSDVSGDIELGLSGKNHLPDLKASQNSSQQKGVTVKIPSQQTIQLNRTTGAQSDHFIQSAPPQEVGSERLQTRSSGGPQHNPGSNLEKKEGRSSDESCSLFSNASNVSQDESEAEDDIPSYFNKDNNDIRKYLAKPVSHSLDI